MSDQFEPAANLMVRDYLILAFLVSLGALQIVTSISGIRGLWLFSRRDVTRVLGILLIASGLAYYIFSPLWIEGPWAAGSVINGTSEGRIWGTATLAEISGVRNLNDIHGGMAGTAYAGYFILSAVLATIFAAIVGGIRQRLSGNVSSPSNADGLDGLKHTDPLSTLRISFSNLRRDLQPDLRRMMRSTRRWSIPSLIERTWRN